MSASFYDLLKYAKTGIAAPDMTAYDKMRAVAMAGGKVKTLTGVPPLSFRANGKPLISWSILGNGSQSGTPTPDAPIMPTFCGKLVGTDWTIPITCAGQTTPIYLGQTQTVRRIKKLVLTGEEGFEMSETTQGGFYLSSVSDYLRKLGNITGVCTHYSASAQTQGMSTVPDKTTSFYGTSQYDRLYIHDSSFASKDDFKQWLASEYAAGTPVTVWYVLETPETGIVNEPLAKIGSYADVLNSEDSGVSIPTARGQNTLTVDTDLKPSSMTITYRG